MRAIARLLSVVFHPVWMPTAIVVMAFNLHPYLALRFIGDGRLNILFVMVLVMTAVFPLLSVWMFKRGGLLSGFTMPARGERTLVYAVTLIYVAMCYWLLRRTAGHPMLLELFFGACLVLALVLVINLRWKISAHMAGAGGVVGALSALMFLQGVDAPVLFAVVLVLSGALGSSRLLLSDHSPAQVHTGFLLGVLVLFMSAVWGWRV